MTFRERRHAAIAGFGFLLVIIGVLWVGSAGPLGFILKSPLFGIAEKAALIAKTLIAGFAIFKPLSFAATLTIAALFGINLAMTVHYFRCKASFGASAGAGAVGALVGMLGAGCAACGSVALSAILGAGATAGLIGILPFDGLEFSLLGAAVLMLSINLVAKKIADPSACPLPPARKRD